MTKDVNVFVEKSWCTNASTDNNDSPCRSR
jgi:hypothetical protein